MTLETAVPATLNAVLDPEWLGWALDLGAGQEVVDVEMVDDQLTIAEKVRIRATIAGPNGQHRTRALCIKCHFGDSPAVVMDSEVRFYREIAMHLDVRTPRAAYGAVDYGSRHGVLIMDDVIAAGGRVLNAHEPYPLDVARDSLGQLARLHAATWGIPDFADEEWLAPRIERIGSRYTTDYLQGLLDDGRGPDVAPELRDGANVAAAMKRASEQPVTCVIHGDAHAGNTYLDADGRLCWLDWQVVQQGNWATDIAYHVATILDIEDRRAHEADLLRHYLDELAASGGPTLSWDQAWEQYTLGFAYGYFMWVITRLHSRAIVEIHIPRLATALSDHDTFRRLGVV